MITIMIKIMVTVHVQCSPATFNIISMLSRQSILLVEYTKSRYSYKSADLSLTNFIIYTMKYIVPSTPHHRQEVKL